MRNPTRQTRAGCCARAERGKATAAPPSSVMNSRRPMKAVIWSLQPEGLQAHRIAQSYRLPLGKKDALGAFPFPSARPI